jgi:hypothetical protein
VSLLSAVLGPIATEAGDDGRWRGGMSCEARRHSYPRLPVDGFYEAQGQFGVLTILVPRVCRFLHIEIGEDAQQRWTHVDATARCKIGEAIETGKRRDRHYA